MSKTDNLIKILQGVNYSRTITELADSLYLSQPYLSRLIKEAENKYGVKIVNRTTKPISLTNAGKVVLDNLKQIQDDRERMAKSLDNLKRIEHQSITIAFNSLISNATILELLDDLFQNFPDANFNIITDGRSYSETDLINQNIDILVGQKWNNLLFSIRTLQIHKLAMLIPSSCPLYRPNRYYCPFSQNNLTTLNNHTYIAASNNTFLQQQVNRFLKSNHILIRQIGTVSNPYMAAKVAIMRHSTTITTKEIAQAALPVNADYNLMVFPPDVLNLQIAISALNDASPLVKKVSQFLYQSLAEEKDSTELTAKED